MNDHRTARHGFLGFGILILAAGIWPWAVSAQCVFTPWGNLNGMRIAGVPVDFEAGLRWVHPEWAGFSSAVKYLQRPKYSRNGPTAVVESAIEGVEFREELRETGQGSATLEVQVTSRTNLALAGGFFCVDLPDATFGGGTLEVLGASSGSQRELRLSASAGGRSGEWLRQVGEGVSVGAVGRTLKMRWDGARTVVIRRDASDRPTSLNDPSVRQRLEQGPGRREPSGFQVYVELFAGDCVPGMEATATFQWQVEAVQDPTPVRLALNTTQPGRAFQGIGGNFRLQFPETDAAVIRYNLEHLPVAWGRLDLPWAEWHPDETVDPLVAARAGSLHPRFRAAMETARTLARRRIPVMLGAWTPPRWARAVSQPAGLRGTALEAAKIDRVCESLASALLFLKENAGVEASHFSFNEPETGVEVRQTAEEHAEFIRRMGLELVRRGLATRLLLGDTAHGTPAALEFLTPSIADPRLHRHIGAVAFHTWRGCTPSDLARWSDAAGRLGVPLMVTEGGPDAHLHEYPGVRLESWFQLQEIELYVRCCAYGQVSAILEWQLTTDYSVLSGGGVYGESGPLKPTQRFWNLQQLGMTPIGAFALPLTSDRADITCAAFGDLAAGSYVVHIVNRGGARVAQLAGLPAGLTRCRRILTDAERGRADDGFVEVRQGKAEWMLPPASYTTLLGTVGGR
jgi:hypothetical protein